MRRHHRRRPVATQAKTGHASTKFLALATLHSKIILPLLVAATPVTLSTRITYLRDTRDGLTALEMTFRSDRGMTAHYKYNTIVQSRYIFLAIGCDKEEYEVRTQFPARGTACTASLGDGDLVSFQQGERRSALPLAAP